MDQKDIDEQNVSMFKNSLSVVSNPIVRTKKCFQVPMQVNFCCFCQVHLSNSSVVIPSVARLDLFVEHDAYVHPQQKGCFHHLKGTRLDPDIITDTSQYEPAILTSEEAADLLFQLKNEIKSKRNRSLLDNPLMDNEDLKTWTGWEKSNLLAMQRTVLDSKAMRDSQHRTISDALIMFWVKLKTNLAYGQTGTLFNYDLSAEDRGKRVAESCDAIMDVLRKYFVPNYLGFSHLTERQAFAHDTTYSKIFLEME
ncbi:unnamed protein product [Didymodactylos carnosus]|uniref:Uncharacterized protein n=2 Tax=Didymodactylos carnosus TaxID=1234261 RepID=A0A815HM99_9BILA|nr:unnamed protein product [Didymodactylos carnosus]CAF4231118.1 unnamed protein product [Didymodactylos carnosus]